MGDVSSDDGDDDDRHLRASDSIAEMDPKLLSGFQGTPPSSLHPPQAKDRDCEGDTSSPPSSKKCVSFSPKRQKKFVPHFSEYSDKQRQKLWYTSNELDAIKHEQTIQEQMEILQRKQSKASLALAAAQSSSRRFQSKEKRERDQRQQRERKQQDDKRKQSKKKQQQQAEGVYQWRRQKQKQEQEERRPKQHNDDQNLPKSPKQPTTKRTFTREIKKYLISMTDTYSKLGLGASSFADTERYKEHHHHDNAISKRRMKLYTNSRSKSPKSRPPRRRRSSSFAEGNSRDCHYQGDAMLTVGASPNFDGDVASKEHCYKEETTATTIGMGVPSNTGEQQRPHEEEYGGPTRPVLPRRISL